MSTYEPSIFWPKPALEPKIPEDVVARMARLIVRMAQDETFDPLTVLDLRRDARSILGQIPPEVFNAKG